MHTLWHWLLWCLTVWSHDPATLAAERARCAGAVVVAYAALAQEPVAPKQDDAEKQAPDATPAAPERVAPRQGISKKKTPEFPTEPTPCPKCNDTGRIYRNDGGWVRCPCGACPTGRCKPAR